VAVVVEDLDRTEEMLTALGLPVLVTSRDGARRFRSLEYGVQDVVLSVAWTVLGSLTVELVQGARGTIFEPAGPAYLHHITFAVDDVAAERSKWEALGYPLVLEAEGATATFSYFRLFGGVLACFISSGRPYPAAPLLREHGLDP
jgi:hypothetical protein